MRIIQTILCFLLVVLVVPNEAFAQKVTRVTGVVLDAETREPLPFVNVYYQGTQIGTSTDLDGAFTIHTRFPSDSIQVTFLGYKTMAKAIFREKRQEINFKMVSTSVSLNTVTVTAEKAKYSKKNNPAVELIKKVLANKKNNSLKGQDYYSYDKYEKIEFDLNNITEKFTDRNVFNNYQFIFDYIDTSEVNGKPYLPVFLRETLSKVYYRKNPEKEREIKEAVNLTNLSTTIDDKTIDNVLNLLYQKVDIYDEKMLMLGNEFISPVSDRAINFYRFYIQDTISVDDISLIKLAFIPRNKLDFGFTGHLYISNDDQYFVKKAELGILSGMNLNFVRDMKIIQEFSPTEDAFVLDKDLVFVDYALTKNGIGAYGTRTNSFKNYSFDPPEDKSVYDGEEKTIVLKDAYEKGLSYWSDQRFEPLSETESGVYEMIDTLNNNPSFKRLKYVGYVAATGYAPVGPVEIGPLATFLSFNDVEGTRYKFGGESNFDYLKRMNIGGYVAYGTNDKRYKYSGTALFSFGKDYRKTPFKHLELDYTKDVTFPGIRLDNIKTDNILLSFRRGETNRMVLDESFRVKYINEGKIYDYTLVAERSSREPYGDLVLPYLENDVPKSLDKIRTFEAGFDLRFAPNQVFVQGRTYRTNVLTRFPILTLGYRAGIKDFLDSEYNYHKVTAGLAKKFYWGIMGQTRFTLETGKIWGKLPYLLYHIPRANQTYAYQRYSFNMMNFMEFTADEYVTVSFQHFFLGAIFNEIPLLRKLKLREIITGKLLYGRLTDENNPELDPTLVQFQNNADGVPLTYSLNGQPYFEGSFGISNIFKIFRLDLVKRFTHLDNPNVPVLFGVKGMGIRARFKIEF